MRCTIAAVLSLLLTVVTEAQMLRTATPVCDELSETTNWYINELRSGILFVSSTEGLNVIIGERTMILRSSTSPLFDSNIQSNFYSHGDDDVWFCSYRGFYKLDLESFGLTAFRLDDRSGRPITHDYKIIALAGHRLFIRTTEGVASWDVLTHDYRWHDEINNAATSYLIWGHAQTQLMTIEQDSILTLYGLTDANIFEVEEKIIVHGASRWRTTASADKAGLLSDNGKYIRAVGRNISKYEIGAPFPRTIDENENILWLNYSDYLIWFDLTTLVLAAEPIYFVNPLTGERLGDISTLEVGKQGAGMLASRGGGVFSFDLESPFTTPFWGEDLLSTANTTGLYMHNNMIVSTTRDEGVVFADTSLHFLSQIKYKQANKPLSIRRSAIKGDTMYFTGDGTELGTIDLRTRQSNSYRSHDGEFRYWYQLATTNDNRILGNAMGEGIGEIIPRDGHYYFKKLISSRSKDEPLTYFKPIWDSLLLISDNEDRVLVAKLHKDSIEIIKTIPVPGITDAYCRDNDRSVLYIVNSDGLFKVSFNEESIESHLVEDNRHLPCEAHAITGDKTGRIWMSTNRGLICWYPTENRSVRYTHFDGVISREFNPNVLLQYGNRIVFGGLNGVTSLKPENVGVDTNEVRVFISAVEINDRAADTTIWDINSSQLGDLQYRQRTITFDVDAIDYIRPANLNLRYRLVGADEDWVEVGSNTVTARYSKLRPGDYKFQVAAANASGIWNQTPRVVAFTVLPPFWQTIWFQVIVGCLLLLLIYGLYQLRLQLLRQQYAAVDAERSRIASDVHDDLGGGFTSIRTLSHLALKHAENAAQAARIQRLADVSERTSAGLREVIWAMDSRNDNSERLGVHIRQYAAQFMEQHQFPIDTSISLRDKQATIRAEKRRTILLIVKEILHNIVKHSSASGVVLEIVQDEDFVVKVTELGGEGFDVETAIRGGGHGIRNIHQRIEGINGTVNFMKTGNDFVTIIRIPFDKNL